MRKLFYLFSLATLLALTGVSKGYAQYHSDRIMVGLGAMIDKSLDATISYEHETKYHNAWEYFATASLQWDDCATCGHICDDSFWNNYNTIRGGVAYKPCVFRGRNNYGNVRVGGSLGYDSDKDLVAGLHLGYEHSYALKSGWQLYWQVRCDGIFWARDFLKGGATIGFKIPTGNKR